MMEYKGFTRPLAGALAIALSACAGGGNDQTSRCGAWPAELLLPDNLPGSMVTDIHGDGACGLVAVGYFNAALPQQPSGDTDGFVLRWQLGADGIASEDWRRIVRTAQTDVLTQIEVDANGAWRILGWTNGSLPGQASAGKSDVIVATLSRDGTELSWSQFGDERPNRPLRLLQHGSAGITWLIGNDDVYIPTNYVAAWEEPWIATLSSSVPPIMANHWQRNGTEANDRYFTVSKAPDGDDLVLALGSDTAGLSFERRDPSGVRLWQATLSNSPIDMVAVMAPRKDGRVLTYGASYLDLGAGNTGSADLFVASIDANNGTPTALASFGSADTDWAVDLLAMDSSLLAMSQTVPLNPEDWQIGLHALTPDGVWRSSRWWKPAVYGELTSITQVGHQWAAAGAIGDSPETLQGWVTFGETDQPIPAFSGA